MTDNPQVYIVGAGPGDPALLTLKAHDLLANWADIVVYDRLITDEILAFIPNNIERIYAGKSCKKHHMTQSEINAELVSQAKSGKKVVRLKGGDPFIFGRAGEEVLHLLENNISFEIVPGISAASGIAAQYNIPLTHRGVANCVTYITGHQQKGQAVDLDWNAFRSKDNTIVIYMGLSNLDKITAKLIEHGLSKNTPAIAIQDGTITGGKYHQSTVENLANELREEGFTPPTIIIIGDVVGLVPALR